MRGEAVGGLLGHRRRRQLRAGRVGAPEAQDAQEDQQAEGDLHDRPPRRDHQGAGREVPFRADLPGPLGHRPFSRNGIRCRFRRLRAKLPHLEGVVSYCYRHSFITDALANGVPAATVAELVGHKDLKMIQDHYSHLAEKTQLLRDAAERATRKAE